MTQSSGSEREYDEQVQGLVTDTDARAIAPYPVAARLLALAGTAEVRAATCRTQLDEPGGRRAWEAVWLLETTLVYVRASRADADWTGFDDNSGGRSAPDDEVESWRRPLRTIAALSVDDLTSRGSKWRSSLCVTFLDGTRIEVPERPTPVVMAQDRNGLADLGRMLRDQL